MRWIIAGTVVFLLGTITVANAGEDATKEDKSDMVEWKKLEGTWIVVAAKMEGAKGVSRLKNAKIIVTADDMWLKLEDWNENEWVMLYKIDSSQKPKHIDFSDGYKTKKGIYDLDGDDLKFCVALVDERPVEFSDKGQLLLILKRKKTR